MFRKGKREISVDSAVVEALETRAEALERAWLGMEHNPLETLQDCVGRLPDRYRDAVEILYRGDRSVSEVAAATEMGMEAAKKRLQRARHLLRIVFERKGCWREFRRNRTRSRPRSRRTNHRRDVPGVAFDRAA